MVTLWFKPGPNKLVMVRAIKTSAHISLAAAKDAVEIHRIKCEDAYKNEVIKAIESAGGKLV